MSGSCRSYPGAVFIRTTNYRVPALFASAVGVAHLFAGRFGWLARYEIYAWGVIVLVNMVLYEYQIQKVFQSVTRVKIWAILVLALFLLTPDYIQKTAFTVSAANDIYSEQYQMHRFVTEYYKAPVAVNDIGWVSCGNIRYVLDLR